MPHSIEYNELTTEGPNSEILLDAVKLQFYFSRFFLPEQGIDDKYDKIHNLLHEVNDAQFNIISALDARGRWIRDTRELTSLSQKIPHDSSLIKGNNALLRCLSRLRAIDYAIEKTLGSEAVDIRELMENDLYSIIKNISKIAQSPNKTGAQRLNEINKQEEQFNTFLIEQLHEANLTGGCNTPEDAEKLLSHYSNLSSLLTPARTVITLTPAKEPEILQPVTKKNQQQKDTINDLTKIQPYPFKDERNDHNVQNIATQQANSLFANLLIKDDRTLSTEVIKANKQNTVGNVEFLQQPSDRAIGEFEKNREDFKKALHSYSIANKSSAKKNQFAEAGFSILANINKIVGNNPKFLNAQSIADINLVLTHSKVLIKNQDINNPDVKESTRRLASLSQEVSGKKSPGWKTLGAGLLTFACLALVVAGVLAAIPTGGTSMLAAALGATGLSVGAAGTIGVTAIAGTAIAGAAAYKIGEEKGLAKSISDFKSALHDLKEPLVEVKKEEKTPKP
ncbi:MAG: hypothetical protein Q8M03_03980 [Legionella sp.]|nr:hypothetical protein [Legionella sp.]